MRTEEILEARHQMAILCGHSRLDNVMCCGERLEDPDLRYTRRFEYAGSTGILDGNNFISWKGMGFHLDSAGPALQAAIAEQTGVAL